MATQTTYNSRITALLAGQVVNAELTNKISRSVANSGGLPFGRPATRDSAGDDSVHLTTTGDTTVVGISIIDQANDSASDQYDQYDSAALMTQGKVAVLSGVAVDPGEAAYVVPATGTFTNVSTSNILVGEWDSTTAGNALAVLKVKL